MFNEYKNAVLLDYLQKKESPNFSINLSQPTPARLREECVKVYFERHLEDDNATMRAFFGSPSHANDFTENIKSIDIDKFKPLINFVKGEITTTDAKNIELLAWLIDFKNRPSANWKPTKKGDNKELGLRDKLLGIFAKKKTRNIFVASMLVGGATIAGISIPKPDQQCMYWTGDHYQPIDCKKPIYNKETLALDTLKLYHFKRITTPDTLTKYSINKVYYVKINNKPEFFTAQGYHPAYKERMLRPLSDHILKAHILSKKNPK